MASGALLCRTKLFVLPTPTYYGEKTKTENSASSCTTVCGLTVKDNDSVEIGSVMNYLLQTN